MTWSETENGVYLAGHVAPSGRYRRADPPDGRIIELEAPGLLPASLDGHVAVYLRVDPAPVVETRRSDLARARSRGLD
jgi:hypothetical protein